MRQKLAIVGTILLLIGVLVAINAASYVGEDERRDSELAPNRSSYHAGATGTRALYDFLNESGSKVIRWREVPEKLLSDKKQTVRTFVIIGDTPLSVDEDQAKSLLLWVERGGRLVLIDRRPELRLLPSSGEWKVTTEFGEFPSPTIDPANPSEMTAKVKPVRAVQPTPLTTDVDTVQPSKFAASISFERADQTTKPKTAERQTDWLDDDDEDEESEDSPPAAKPTTITATEAEPASPAPVVHLGTARKLLLVDYPHGQGRILVLADPYIVSNGGISLKDNLQLAINVLGANLPAGTEGLIAFDEYHHGHGATRNALVSYFSGTPVLPILGQIILSFFWFSGHRVVGLLVRFPWRRLTGVPPWSLLLPWRNCSSGPGPSISLWKIFTRARDECWRDMLEPTTTVRGPKSPRGLLRDLRWRRVRWKC